MVEYKIDPGEGNMLAEVLKPLQPMPGGGPVGQQVVALLSD